LKTGRKLGHKNQKDRSFLGKARGGNSRGIALHKKQPMKNLTKYKVKTKLRSMGRCKCRIRHPNVLCP
jgi:hypothetical protein